MYPRTYSDYLKVLENICRDNNYEMKNIGKSVNGQDLYMVKAFSGSQPLARVLITAGQHGNEWPGPALVLLFLNDLGSRNFIPELKEASQYVEYLIIPVVNPDGYDYIRRVNMNCVDLNRNWPVGWGGRGATKGTCCPVCCGHKPLDQPETNSVYYRVLFKETFDIHLDLHTGVEVLAYPYACDIYGRPENEEEYVEICNLHEEIARRNNIEPYPWGWIPVSKVDIPPEAEEMYRGLKIYTCCGVLSDTVHRTFNKPSLVLEATMPHIPPFEIVKRKYYPRFQCVLAALSLHVLGNKMKQVTLGTSIVLAVATIGLSSFIAYKLARR